VDPFKKNTVNKGAAGWERFHDSAGCLGVARNKWLPKWALHNANGIPSGKTKAEHILAFRKQMYDEAKKEAKEEVDVDKENNSNGTDAVAGEAVVIGGNKECEAWKNWYPAWWKIFMHYGPGSNDPAPIFSGAPATIPPEPAATPGARDLSPAVPRLRAVDIDIDLTATAGDEREPSLKRRKTSPDSSASTAAGADPADRLDTAVAPDVSARAAGEGDAEVVRAEERGMRLFVIRE
jgi:hypothetical protein